MKTKKAKIKKMTKTIFLSNEKATIFLRNKFFKIKETPVYFTIPYVLSILDT